MCDIDNPLYGKDGAAYVFSPQKGASSKMVSELDNNLIHLADMVNKDLGFSSWDFKGAGAAGGMGYGMKAFMGSDIQMGIETLLDIINFDDLIKDADYIFTGEGKLDHQSLRGKVVIGVAKRAKKQGKKVIAVVGNLGEGGLLALNMGVTQIIETNYLNLPFNEAKLRAKEDMIKVISEYINSEAIT